jgi:integrase
MVTPRLVNHIVATLGLKAGVTHHNPRLTHPNPHLFRHSIARFLKSKVFSAEWSGWPSVQNFAITIRKPLGHTDTKELCCQSLPDERHM